MMESYEYVVIGAGPGGYVSAIRAAQLGLKTALIEKDSRLGGTCLNIGCIPSKALLESSEWFHMASNKFGKMGISVKKPALDLPVMMERKERVVKTLTDGIVMLMKKNKVTVLHGKGELTAADRVRITGNDGSSEIEAKHICLAMGSVPVELPFMPFDGETVVSSTDALAFTSVPKQMIVIGAGAIGLELGSVWARLGTKVTVLELLPQIVPFADKQAAQLLQRALKQQGLDIQLEMKVTGMTKNADGRAVVSYVDKKGKELSIEGDKVLVAVGRKPFSGGAGLETVGIVPGKGGQISIDDHFRTSVKNIFAIGDLVHGPMLAHKAEEDGIAVAEIVAGKPGHVNYNTIPSVVYTWPELAMVGLTEAEAKEKGHQVKVGKFYFRGNGRALSMEEPDGMAKIVADADTDRILGVHIIGARASDMIAEAVTFMEFSGSAEDMARTVHAHPTLSEILKEAALAVNKRAIHA